MPDDRNQRKKLIESVVSVEPGTLGFHARRYLRNLGLAVPELYPQFGTTRRTRSARVSRICGTSFCGAMSAASCVPRM